MDPPPDETAVQPIAPAARDAATPDEAAQAAEIRAMDEIIALEGNLEQAKSNAAAEAEELESRLREAEARALQAEERNERLAAEHEEIEAKAREAATAWLRKQLASLKAEARQRVKDEVDKVREETEAQVREETEARIKAEAEEAERLIQEQREDAGDEPEDDDALGEAQRERDAAAESLRQTLAGLEEAEMRATKAEEALAAAEAKPGTDPDAEDFDVDEKVQRRSPRRTGAERRSSNGDSRRSGRRPEVR